MGRCPECQEWDTLIEENALRPASRSPSPSLLTLPYSEVDQETFTRIRTSNSEFDRVMGGGIVPGSLVLLGGEPGIGKSTLLLQIAETLGKLDFPVLYIAGEESPHQIKMRGNRLQIAGSNLSLTSETSIERILEEASQMDLGALIVDSIQTTYSEELQSIPGSIAQIRECALKFLHFAKNQGVPVFLIGHVTKDGSLAGPKALEHIVDTVLYFEGDRHHNQKIVRAVKNRFGPANELGIFEMTSRGLRCVENPSRLFLAERAQDASGSVVLCALQGSRPVLVEVQALVSQSNFSSARRMANGVDPNRIALLLAMLEKRAGMHLLGTDVYVNVAGGISLSEPALDLALVGAVASSFNDKSLPSDTVVFGEVGLAGEVRAVSFVQTRVKEASNLGFRRVILPASNLPLPEPAQNLALQGVSSIKDFLEGIDFW